MCKWGLKQSVTLEALVYLHADGRAYNIVLDTKLKQTFGSVTVMNCKWFQWLKCCIPSLLGESFDLWVELVRRYEGLIFKENMLRIIRWQTESLLWMAVAHTYALYAQVMICIFFFPFLMLAHTQRLVHIQSMLKRAPSYRTLELELIEWQERELFEYFVVVSLKKKPSKNTYLPEVTYQFPKVKAKFLYTPYSKC